MFGTKERTECFRRMATRRTEQFGDMQTVGSLEKFRGSDIVACMWDEVAVAAA
jgi:hypothetical protein